MNIFLIILIILIVVEVLFTILKRFIFAIFFAIFILIFFCISFVWNANDLIYNLNLDKAFKTETTAKITKIYDNYTTKRDNHDIFNDTK